MKFDMKKPCKDCPFVVGSATNETLAEGRIESIVDDLRNDMSFTCHKTLYTEKKVEEQHCGGALIFLERENRPNQIMRMAERIGLYNHKELDMDVRNLIENEDY